MTAAFAAVRLGPRDRNLLARLAAHEPLTTSELRLLFFSGESRCRRRLRALEAHGLLTRVFPARSPRGGSSEALWFLSRDGRRTIDAPARREPALSIPDLEHRRAVAQFFCTLIRRSLDRPGEGLWSWLGERASEQGLDRAARPDGYGRYLLPHGEITFYLELDRGTETQARLREKVNAYRNALAADEHVALANVLLIAPSQRRLRALHVTALDGPPWIWTSSDANQYRLLGDREPHGLVELPAWPRDPAKRVDGCLGRRWRTN